MSGFFSSIFSSALKVLADFNVLASWPYKILLWLGADVDQLDQYGNTLLYNAVEAEKLEMVKLLVELGADVHQADKYGSSLLYSAVQGGRLEMAKLLIELGADVHQVNKYGISLLYRAAQDGRLEVVKLLIELGADIHQVSKYGFSQLYHAVIDGKLEIVKLLVELGADIHQVNNYGSSPLYHAVTNGKLGMVKLLVELGADVHQVDKYGYTLLYSAVKNENLEMVELLINKGADVISVHSSDSSPLAICGNPEIFKLLITKGADANICSIGIKNAEIFEILITSSINIYKPDQNGLTIIDKAVVHNCNPEVLQAFRNLENFDGLRSVLDAMNDKEKEAYLKNMLSKSLTVSGGDNRYYQKNLLKFLNDYGFDLKSINVTLNCSLVNDSGIKANLLALRILEKNFEDASYLLSIGFDIESKIKNKTLLYYANSQGDQDAIKFLLEHDAKVDPDNPIINKIPFKELKALIAETTDKVLDITNLLVSKGFAPNLDDYYLELPNNKFEQVSLTDISFKNGAIISYKGTVLALDRSNLEDANIEGCHLGVADISLIDTNMKGMNAYVTPELVSTLSLTQKQEADVTIVDEDHYFYQFKLVNKYKDILPYGICHGLAREYARHALNAKQKESAEKNFFHKLQTKFNEPGDDFLQRLSSYTKHNFLDTRYSKKHFKIELEANKENTKFQEIDFLNLLPDKLLKSDFLTLQLEGHACVLRTLRDDNKNVTGYKIYDTSYGETILLTYGEMNKGINILINDWLSIDTDKAFHVSDLEKEVKKLNLVKHDSTEAVFSKDSKNTFKLFKAIDENDIPEIIKLSSVTKIDYHGLLNESNTEPLLGHIYTNILDYAIFKGTEQALVALVTTNQLLKFNKISLLAEMLGNLMLFNKLTPAVLDAFANHQAIQSNLDAMQLISEARLANCKIEISADKDIAITAALTPETKHLFEAVGESMIGLDSKPGFKLDIEDEILVLHTPIETQSSIDN